MNLSEFISSGDRIILIDGAMGTQLAEKGLEMGASNNLTHPDAVLEIHRQYVDCGVDFVTTNTFTLNRANMEFHKSTLDVREANLAGVRLARHAAGKDRYILGDMGPTGKMLKPYGPLPENEAYESFREQAAILAEGGVDGFIIETMFELKEALIAVRACKDASGLPVIASMTFNTLVGGGKTVMGNSAKDCVAALTEAGVSAVGTNCGNLDPFQIAEIVVVMSGNTALPIVAQPNAGKPQFVDNRTFFTMSPAEFAEGVAECIKAGARLVGGCCGTSPAHIRALAEKLAEFRLS
ncbi:MAG TPA: homocysteine S-methyltransferase family protein [Syntrophorhabdaceae bacterium]|jgi:methionine synthase I (cobalamin-dependent)